MLDASALNWIVLPKACARCEPLYIINGLRHCMLIGMAAFIVSLLFFVESVLPAYSSEDCSGS